MADVRGLGILRPKFEDMRECIAAGCLFACARIPTIATLLISTMYGHFS